MAQRFQEPAHAPRAVRRAEQHRHAEAFAGFAGEVLEHFLRGRGLVHQQLLEKLVIVVGELLEHMGARFDLALLKLRRDLDPLGFLARPIFERALQRQVDEAVHFLAVPNRNLAGDQRRYAHRLERGQEVADPAVGLVDAVDEDQMGDAELVERAQRRGGEGRPRRVGIDDDDRDVGDRQRPRAVGGKADRARAIEDCERVVEILEIVEVELGRAAALSRFRARIADAGAVGRRSQSIGGAGCEQHRLGKAGLSRAGGSHQRDHSGAFGFSSLIVDHVRLSLRAVTGARVALEGARAPIRKPPPSACFSRKARGVVTDTARCAAKRGR